MMIDHQWVSVLGSTGSIGVNTLNVIAQHPERFSVFALSAHKNVDLLYEQCRAFKPRYAVISEANLANELMSKLVDDAIDTEVLVGADKLADIAAAPEVDCVMAAIVGAAGLLPTLAAVKAGKRVLLANKEALVMSGALFMDAVKTYDAELLPIDSEHNAIFQCLPQVDTTRASRTKGVLAMSKPAMDFGVRKIILTASGGPFRSWSQEQLSAVTPAQACKHPNWSMGQKISVDSATLMNKGLELIEACWLFSVSPDNVEVLIHPQSIVHSMVEYLDGSVLAQMGNPDMRTPIANALTWPERIDSGVASLDLIRQSDLSFEEPDLVKFPCLDLARQAFFMGGTAMAALNAANEVAVSAFLGEQIRFLDIPSLVADVLQQHNVRAADSLDVILEADQEAREIAKKLTYELELGSVAG